MTETTELRPDIDWGPNADGWEFIIENRTQHDLQIDYSPSSNVGWADPKTIRAGQSGRVQGVKGVFDPADMDFSYSQTSGLGWSIIAIRSSFGGVTRIVRNDPDRVIEAYFPDQPRTEVQRVVVQPVDFWGPNADGWEITVTNDTSVDLYLYTTVFSNIEDGDRQIKAGSTGRVKGKHNLSGGPMNCNFGYYANPDEKDPDKRNGTGLAMTADDAGNPKLVPVSSGNIGAQVFTQARSITQTVTLVHK
jgi:hypothetical protein